MSKRPKSGELTPQESERYERLLYAEDYGAHLTEDERAELEALECRLFMYGEQIPLV